MQPETSFVLFGVEAGVIKIRLQANLRFIACAGIPIDTMKDPAAKVRS